MEQSRFSITPFKEGHYVINAEALGRVRFLKEQFFLTILIFIPVSVNQLSNQRIHPYTDLLLHDMGDALADNRPDYLANGNEWRTTPLWGIGLFQKTNGIPYYLHDGRARTFEEAILWHGGEAEKSKQQFMQLQKGDRDKLNKFLNSL